VLAKSCRYSLQLLDVEGSRDVTDECVSHLTYFKLRELNIFNTCVTRNGLAGILQTLKGLAVLTRGVRMCEALAYQVSSALPFSWQSILRL
jgi:hypothetical protein